MNRTWGYVLIAGAILLGSFWMTDAACTPLGSSTTNFSLCKPAVGEVGWGAVVNANMDTIDANLTNSLPRSYLAGFGLTNNAAATATKVDIAAGQAQDVANASALSLNATLTKDLSAPWAVGSGNGCLGTSVSRTVSTWYHVFIIKRTDTSVVDAYCDTSVSAGNIPSPYTLYRRIGSIRTDATGSGQIIAFTQDGDYFRWSQSVLEFSTTNPGTAAVSATLASVPPGVRVQALINGTLVQNGASLSSVYFSDLSANDEAPVSTGNLTPAVPGATIGGYVGPTNSVQQLMIHTNTTQQIRYRLSFSDANMKIAVVTLGWIDRRGRDN